MIKDKKSIEEFEVCERPAWKPALRGQPGNYWTRLVLKLQELEPDMAIRVKSSDIPRFEKYKGGTRGTIWSKAQQRLRLALQQAGLWEQGVRPQHAWDEDGVSIYIWLRQLEPAEEPKPEMPPWGDAI